MNINYPGYLVLYSLLVLTLTTDFSTETSLDWFEAQEQCRDRGGLTINTKESIESYWIGRYRRITPWIKIKGCYKDSFFSNIIVKFNRTMIRASVGICQEFCQQQNTTMFAVKVKNCICITGVNGTSLSESVSPSNCNFKCFTVIKDLYENECGGNSSYTVFEFESREFGEKYECLSLQCSYAQFIPKPCSDALSKVCEIRESSSGTALSWTNAMEDCKLADKPSYLFGDVDLQNAALACSKVTIPNQSVIGWIGVARQRFLNVDTGWGFSKTERQSFIECRKCHNGNCFYINCSTKIDNSVYCEVPNRTVTIVSSSRKSIIYTTPLDTKTSTNRQPTLHITKYTTESETLNIDQESSTEQTGVEESKSYTLTFLPVIAVLGFLSILAVILMFYFRRRRNLGNTDGSKKTLVESTSVKNVRAVKNSLPRCSHFELKGNSQKITQRSKVISSSPYNDAEEGEYDHLRDTCSRKDKQEEDTYQHASAGISNDVSDYDTMANSSVIKMTEEEGTYDHAHTPVNKMSEEDGTYDHARPVNNSNSDNDYGYNMPICETLNDNPYNIS